MAILAAGIWVVWYVLAVFIVSLPFAKAGAAGMAVLMFLLARGIALGRPWARWTSFTILAALGLIQGIIIIGIIISSVRPTGPKPILGSPIPLAIPLLLALFCLTAASFLLRKKEAGHFKNSKKEGLLTPS